MRDRFGDRAWWPGAKRACLFLLAIAVAAVWSREVVHRAGIGTLTAGLLAALVIVGLAVRFAAATPAVVLLLTAVVPYPVSFVGKTPFGVTTAAGGLALLIAITALIIRETRHLKGPEVETGTKILLIWICWITLSAATSFAPKIALNDARQLLFALPVAYIVGRFFGRNFCGALQICYMAIVLVAVLGIVQAATGFDPIKLVPSSAHFPLVDPGESYRNGLVRVRVGFYHASDLGRVLAMALPLLLVAAVRKFAALWIRIGTVLVIVAILLTLTFTVWVAAAVGVVVLIAASRTRGRGTMVGVALLAVVLVVGIGGPVTQLVEARIHPTGSSLAEEDLRLALIPASVAYADSHRFLGAGPGTFTVLSIEYPINGVETVLVDDNSFTTEVVEVGYPGLFLLVLGLGVLALGWWRKRGSPLYAASLASLATFVVCSCTVDSLVRDAPLIAGWLLLGVATGSGTLSRRSDHSVDDALEGSISTAVQV
jgi:hypothetical protein